MVLFCSLDVSLPVYRGAIFAEYYACTLVVCWTTFLHSIRERILGLPPQSSLEVSLALVALVGLGLLLGQLVKGLAG